MDALELDGDPVAASKNKDSLWIDDLNKILMKKDDITDGYVEYEYEYDPDNNNDDKSYKNDKDSDNKKRYKTLQMIEKWIELMRYICWFSKNFCGYSIPETKKQYIRTIVEILSIMLDINDHELIMDCLGTIVIVVVTPCALDPSINNNNVP